MAYPTLHLPKMYNVELCKKVYLLREERPDLSHFEMSEELVGDRSLRPTIQRWLGSPERYSPWVDDVAVDRAFKERAVYDTLSVLERWTFWDRWAPVVQAEYDTKSSNRPGSMPTRDNMIQLLGCTLDALSRVVDGWGAARARTSA